ncbi:MAG: polyprenol monophosphomannose synthase [Actinobacteria bacterium]|nr:polyprenol monophosphomannose synthase [Actinomycetota bacterium]
MKRLIIIPTYNELANAPILIERIFKRIPTAHILIIDDGSPDKTGEKIKEIQKRYPALSLLERASKSGLGSAYRTGFAWGIERGYEELIEMDADLSHRVRDLKRMIEAKELQPNTDLVIGSRWVSGGNTENWSKSRELLSRAANLYVRAMLGMGVKDSTAGFRIYSSSILERLNLEAIKSEGYSFQIEMTRAVYKLGGKIIEVPITFRERENGVSKMSKNIVREAMLLVTIWGLKRFLRVK